MQSTICDMCGKKGTRIRRVTRSYSQEKVEFLIRGIPVVTCPHCGESYLTADTLHEVKRIKLHRHQLAVELPIAVAQYGRTAKRNTGADRGRHLHSS